VVEWGELVGGAFELLVDLWDWWPEGKAGRNDQPEPLPEPEYHERPVGRTERV